MTKQVRARFYRRAGELGGTGEGGPPVSAMREHPRLENRETWGTRYVRHYYHRTYDCDLPGNRDRELGRNTTRKTPRPAGECTDLRDDGLNYWLNHSEAYDLR
jgi:hypothetical protein